MRVSRLTNLVLLLVLAQVALLLVRTRLGLTPGLLPRGLPRVPSPPSRPLPSPPLGSHLPPSMTSAPAAATRFRTVKSPQPRHAELAPSQRSGTAAPVDAQTAGTQRAVLLQLPRNVLCLELEDVRAAYSRCAPASHTSPAAGGEGSGRRLACPRSKEKVCREGAAVPPSRCEPLGANDTQLAGQQGERWQPAAQVGNLSASVAGSFGGSDFGGAGGRGGGRVCNGTAACSRRERTGAARMAAVWRAVVFGMAVYDSKQERSLLQAAADTWLQVRRRAAVAQRPHGRGCCW